jgi:hypothetical protein
LEVAEDGLGYLAFRWYFDTFDAKTQAATGFDHVSFDYNGMKMSNFSIGLTILRVFSDHMFPFLSFSLNYQLVDIPQAVSFSHTMTFITTPSVRKNGSI